MCGGDVALNYFDHLFTLILFLFTIVNIIILFMILHTQELPSRSQQVAVRFSHLVQLI